MKHFTALLTDRGCWTFHRHSVTRAFALALFIAFIPPTPLPVHLLACTVLGMYFRLNLPVMFATVLLSNPLTWFPQVAGSLWVGAKLMRLDLMPMLHAVKHQSFSADISGLWAPLLLGALVLGLIAAAFGFILAEVAWRARVILHLRSRRARSGGGRSGGGRSGGRRPALH